ncbi:MAG: tetraacyldisaccharide 4'-kinase [Betaproteobacteria bacterium]
MHVIETFWYRIRPAHLLLVPLSLIYRAVIAVRRALYRSGQLASERLSVPVIVIGNVTVGGTGKTPLAIWLAQYLIAQGYRPGIITRGYGGSEALQEVRSNSDPLSAGDEPVLLARRAASPVFAGRKRAAAALALLAAHPQCDVIISDDGLQHYALARDIEIAVVDGERRFGNGWLLPAGPLREPVARLSQTDAVVVNGTIGIQQIRAAQFRMQLVGDSFANIAKPQMRAPAAAFCGKSAHAIAGIGHPQRFFAQLEALGLDVRAHAFPDHHAFAADDLAFAGDAIVLMTEKDAVKCAAFARENWWYLPVDAEIDPALGNLILAKLRSRNGRQAA